MKLNPLSHEPIDESHDSDDPLNLDYRQLALDSKDTLLELIEKTSLSGPVGEKARSLLLPQWLLENYESHESTSILRSMVYDHYVQFCSDYRVEPVNSASFGKFIRAVFPGIKTRRLGTRGKSKYHYCGIRPRFGVQPSQVGTPEGSVSALAAIQQLAAAAAAGQMSMPGSPHVPAPTAMPQTPIVFPPPPPQGSSSKMPTPIPTAFPPMMPPPGHFDPSIMHPHPMPPPMDEKFMIKLPEIPNPTSFTSLHIPVGITMDRIKVFFQKYKEHQQTLVQACQLIRFPDVEFLLKGFWTNLNTESRTIAECQAVVESLCQYDSTVYDIIMNALIPNILYPMPLYVIQAIRHLARSLEGWIQKAMEGYSPEFMARKLEVSRAFSVQLRRHTSINHLSQASSAIFENGEQIQQMVHDWNRLDLESIREQASWICECRKTDVIQIMEIEFRQMLQGKSRLDQWTAWLESIVNKFLGPIKSEQQMTEDDAQELTKKGRNLILKWGFYSSLALRELTLKSSASFGSFQILRLLFDEYIVYLVEKRIIETLKGPLCE